MLDVAASDERADRRTARRWCCAPSPTSCSAAAPTRMKDLVQPVRRQPQRCAAVARARACAAGQMGRGARRLPLARYRDRDAAGRTAALRLHRRPCAPRSRCATYGARRRACSTNSRRSAPAPQRDADLTVLKGRVMEGLGPPRRGADASIARPRNRRDRPAAARGRLREIALRQSIGEMKRDDATAALETLTTVWRGDETEAEALQLLGAPLCRGTAAIATRSRSCAPRSSAYPHSEMTRRIQDEAAVAFELLFLGGKGDAMPPIDALSLFYDFRDLTPVGRRGDEMIRKLADRLVVGRSARPGRRAAAAPGRQPPAGRGARAGRGAARGDLPDGAQARPRDPGAAREPHGDLPERAAQPAPADRGARAVRRRPAGACARGDRQPARAARSSGCAPTSCGRRGAGAMRPSRSRRSTASAGATSRRSPRPERADMLRAAIGYALAEDAIGLDRFRTKYAPKMADGPDRRAFEVVTAPFNANAPEFGDIAQRGRGGRHARRLPARHPGEISRDDRAGSRASGHA